MKSLKEFPFHKARRITRSEVENFRCGIEELRGEKRPKRKGSPPRGEAGAIERVTASIESYVLAPLKRQAEKEGIDSQTLINQLLYNELA